MENELAHTPRREWIAGALVNVAPSYALHREAMHGALVGPYAYVEGSRVRVRHEVPPAGEPALQRAAAALRVKVAAYADPGLTGPRVQPPVEELAEVPVTSLPGSGEALARKAVDLGFEVTAWRTVAYLPPRGTFGDAVPTLVMRALMLDELGKPLVGVAGLWINGSPAGAKVRTATSVRSIGVGAIAQELLTIAAAVARARARSRNSK